MTAPVIQPPEAPQPPKAWMTQWPHPMLVIVIVLWAVPGAVFDAPWPIGTVLLFTAAMTMMIFAWLALPLLMLIGGVIWIIRTRGVGQTRWTWVAAWVAMVVLGTPLPYFLPNLVGPIGRGVTDAGITGDPIIHNTGDMIAQSATFLIFGAATIAYLTYLARSAPRRPL